MTHLNLMNLPIMTLCGQRTQVSLMTLVTVLNHFKIFGGNKQKILSQTRKIAYIMKKYHLITLAKRMTDLVINGAKNTRSSTRTRRI